LPVEVWNTQRTEMIGRNCKRNGKEIVVSITEDHGLMDYTDNQSEKFACWVNVKKRYN